MELHVFVHFVDDNFVEPEPDTRLDEILEGQDRIFTKLEQLMAKVDDLNAELVEINVTTNELANDVDDLLTQAQGGLSAADADAHVAKLQELKTALQAVASKHTPTGTGEPPVDPASRGFR